MNEKNKVNENHQVNCGKSRHYKSSCLHSAKNSKKGDETHQIRRISMFVRSYRNVITEGLVEGKRHMILLDPAADISLFPKEHVSQGAPNGKNVCVGL